MSVGAAMDFWLDYVDHRGGVSERTSGGALVVIPPGLAAQHGQPEEFVVTTDPEVAEEGGGTLLTAGHPLLMAASEAVLAEGDHGVVRLARPSGRMPDGDSLLEQVRDCFPVEHGRIDLTGGPRRALRQLVRVGALVTFDLSADDQFQEQIECWMDGSERLALPPARGLVLTALLADPHPDRADVDVDDMELVRAVSAADREIRRQAHHRWESMSQQVDHSRTREVERAGEYYREMIDSLESRKRGGSQEKASAYDARIRAAEAERDRRLAEITDKYRGSLTVLPFRLQVVAVPTLRVEVDVRRGERRYPLELDFLTPLRAFTPIRCPHCGGESGLVAGKSRLGCRLCLPKADRPAGGPAVRTPAEPKAAAPNASGDLLDAAKRALPTPTPTPTSRPGSRPGPPMPPPIVSVGVLPKVKPPTVNRPPIRLSARKMAQLGDKFIGQFWERVGRGDASVRRLVAPHSPADTLIRVFGVRGIRLAVGVADDVPIRDVGWSQDSARGAAHIGLTDGFLNESAGRRNGFQIVWQVDHGRVVVDEISPCPGAAWPRLPDARFFGLSAPTWLFGLPTTVPQADDVVSGGLDPSDAVADILLRTTLPGRGLPIFLRCLTSWLRLPDRAGVERDHRPPVIAASLDRMMAYRAGNTLAQYVDVAAAYRVGVTEMKAASTVLQRRLGLSATQPW